MICPYCQTDNRDDREACYYCKKDLSMLRLIVNKARHHYNQGLEYAERGRLDDAISELRNALDLDGTMDNAHVVLGTLYAKKEMFEEARKCWERALALNHNLGKAHEYLHKAEKAEYVFPILKRLRVLNYALGGGLILGLILIIVFAAVSSGRKTELREARKSVRSELAQIQQALVALEEPSNTGRVLKDLEKVALAKKGTPAGDIAEGLAVHIKDEWQRRLGMAAAAIRANNTYATLQILDSVGQDNPSTDVQNAVDRLTATAQEYAIRWVNDSANYFFAGRLPYERFSYEARRYTEYMKDPKAREAVEALRAKVDKANDERLLNEAMELIASGPIVKAVDTAAQWEIQQPQTAGPLRQALEQRLATENAAAGAEVRSLAERGQFDRAGARLEEVRLLYKSIRRPAPDKLLAELEAQLKEARRREAFENALKAYQEKDWEKFLERTADPKALAATTEETVQLTAMRQEAGENQVREALAFFRDRDAAFKAGSLTAEEAARAVKAYPLAAEHLARATTLSTATLLFDAATAQAKLNQPEKALELLKPIAAKYPQAAVAKSAARLQKKLEEALAKKAPPPPPAAAGQTTQTTAVKPAAATKPPDGAATVQKTPAPKAKSSATRSGKKSGKKK